MRVLVLGNSGAGGDWPPLASVMQGLHERGHEVTVLGDETLASALAGTGIPVEALPAEMDLYPLILAYNDRIDEGRPGGFPDAEWAEQCLPRVREIVGRREPDLIVSQLFTIELAARLKADSGLTWCFVNPAYYFGKHCLRPLEEDYVGASHRLAVAWTAKVEAADLVLHATDALFDPVADGLPAHHHHVGPLIWEPPGEPPGYLDEAGDPWALVTLSTAPQAEEIDLARSALRALSEQPVRVLLTVAEGHDREQLGALPRNARVEPYVPHSAVLERGCLSISHAGHGIVAKSMFHGVPQVLIPWDRDQPGVAARARALGVAEVVPRAELSDAALERAVDCVLRDPRYREQARRTADRIRGVDPVSVACEHIEALQGQS